MRPPLQKQQQLATTATPEVAYPTLACPYAVLRGARLPAALLKNRGCSHDDDALFFSRRASFGEERAAEAAVSARFFHSLTSLAQRSEVTGSREDRVVPAWREIPACGRSRLM
ncbi:hypothetical protein MRX96_019440 [Rhipicephalus microplus]